MSVTAIIFDVGSIATAAGVGLGVFQLRVTRQQALTAFEDSFTQLYRDLVAVLPVGAFLNESLTADELERHRGAFYRYFDLCNEQVFLRTNKRISATTWEQWRDGIRKNLGRDAFVKSWEGHFAQQTEGDFQELRRLMDNYELDPAEWPSEPASRALSTREPEASAA